MFASKQPVVLKRVGALKCEDIVRSTDHEFRVFVGSVFLRDQILNPSSCRSWGPLAWLYPSEVQPLETRSAGQALATMVNLTFSFVIGQTWETMPLGFIIPLVPKGLLMFRGAIHPRLSRARCMRIFLIGCENGLLSSILSRKWRPRSCLCALWRTLQPQSTLIYKAHTQSKLVSSESLVFLCHSRASILGWKGRCKHARQSA